MIQSVKFDSSNMDIKKLSNIALMFVIKRLIEILGICISLFGIFIFIALVSYSPNDPNFIFPDNTVIKNILGYQGSFISDFLLQSIGLIAYLVPITFILTGTNIFRKKEIFLLIENTFFIVIYSLFGSLFFNIFYIETFRLFPGSLGSWDTFTFASAFLALPLPLAVPFALTLPLPLPLP